MSFRIHVLLWPWKGTPWVLAVFMLFGPSFPGAENPEESGHWLPSGFAAGVDGSKQPVTKQPGTWQYPAHSPSADRSGKGGATTSLGGLVPSGRVKSSGAFTYYIRGHPRKNSHGWRRNSFEKGNSGNTERKLLVIFLCSCGPRLRGRRAPSQLDSLQLADASFGQLMNQRYRRSCPELPIPFLGSRGGNPQSRSLVGHILEMANI